MKLLKSTFLFNILLISSSFSAQPMNTDEAKSLLLKHPPKWVHEFDVKKEWEENVKVKSLIEVDETFISGFAVIRISKKDGLGFRGEYLHRVGGSDLIELTRGPSSSNAHKLFSKSEHTAIEVVYCCVTHQSGFGRYLVDFYHLSAPIGKDPILTLLPYKAFIASGELGQFFFETSTSTIRYKLKSAEMGLFRVDIKKPLSLAISLHADTRAKLTGKRINLPE